MFRITACFLQDLLMATIQIKTFHAPSIMCFNRLLSIFLSLALAGMCWQKLIRYDLIKGYGYVGDSPSCEVDYPGSWLDELINSTAFHKAGDLKLLPSRIYHHLRKRCSKCLRHAPAPLTLSPPYWIESS